MEQQKEIGRPMLCYFVQGLNTLADNGLAVAQKDMLKLVENKTLIQYLHDSYQQKYWEWQCLLKYQDDICSKLLDYYNLLDDDSYRKLGLKNNGYLMISSVMMEILK